MDHSNPNNYGLSKNEADIMKIDYILSRLEELIKKIPLSKKEQLKRARAKVIFYESWISISQRNGWGYQRLAELSAEKQKWQRRIKWLSMKNNKFKSIPADVIREVCKRWITKG